MMKTWCRNTKFWQERELPAHVCKSGAASAQEKDDMKQINTTGSTNLQK